MNILGVKQAASEIMSIYQIDFIHPNFTNFYVDMNR